MRVYLMFSTSQLSSSLGQSFSCDDLSAYCRTADVMSEIQKMLLSTMRDTYPHAPSLLCDQWINANPNVLSDELRSLYCISF